MRPIDLMCTECGAAPGVMCDASAPRSRPSGRTDLCHYARLDGAEGKPTRPPDPDPARWPVGLASPMMFMGGPIDLGLPDPPVRRNNHQMFASEFTVVNRPSHVDEYVKKLARERAERVEAMCKEAWDMTAPEHRWRLTVIQPPVLSMDDPVIVWALWPPGKDNN